MRRGTSVRHPRSRFEGGIDFIDTADVYPLGGALETVGRTEEIIGRWLRARQARRIVLATKCAGAMGAAANDKGHLAHHVLEPIDDSLRRLRRTSSTSTRCTAFDPTTPIDETLRAFDDLVRGGQGALRRLLELPGLAAGRRSARASGSASRGSTRLQPRYNLLYRDIERELLPLCRSEGLGVIAYNPLAGGFLSGKYRKGDEPPEGTRSRSARGPRYQHRYWHDAQFDAVEALRPLAEARRRRWRPSPSHG